MKLRIRSYHFSSALLLGFSTLSVPILALVVCVAYIKNSASARELLKNDVADSERITSLAITKLFTQAGAAAEGLAEVASSHPNFFSKPESPSVLHSSLTVVNHLGGIYLTLEDGSVRAATRIDNTRRSE